MTAVALPLPRLSSHTELHLERTDLTFFTVTPGRVAIELAVTNVGSRRSEPTLAMLQAAPLGAFVPWQPLTMLKVPALDADESVLLRTEVKTRKTKPLGPPDRVPPRQWLTALGAADDEPLSTRPTGWQAFTRQASGSDSGLAPGRLPADIFELMGRGAFHWAGNLNVFVGGKAVERHSALSIRIYPGEANVAMFVVGTGRDTYRFHLEGEGADWDAALYGVSSLPNLVRGKREPTLALEEWVTLRGQEMLLLALCPPSGCGRGAVEVHVQQRSTGETAVVEFSLDPNATGAGCYVVG